MARARTFESDILQIDLRLIRILPASLTMSHNARSLAPRNTHFATEANPFPAFTDAASGANFII